MKATLLWMLSFLKKEGMMMLAIGISAEGGVFVWWKPFDCADDISIRRNTAIQAVCWENGERADVERILIVANDEVIDNFDVDDYDIKVCNPNP